MSENQSSSNPINDPSLTDLPSSVEPDTQPLDGVSPLMSTLTGEPGGDGVSEDANVAHGKMTAEASMTVLTTDVWASEAQLSDSVEAAPQSDSRAASMTDYMPAVDELAAEPASREMELLSLIHDLNECNDALLAQVSKLEDDVKRTEASARADVEKAQAAVQLLQEKTSRQVSMEQASAQQVSQAAHQQVAKLVSELDTAEQTLSRQVLVNENLNTELMEAQARVAQLEKECALAAQKHAEEVQARVQAENKSRDLRSRLQRQQRYTLQFKAALEKSLSVGASPAASVGAADAARPVSFNQSGYGSGYRSGSYAEQQGAGVTMPRSQRIMPWASAQNTTAFQGIDPHLEALIRRGGKPPIPEATYADAVNDSVVSDSKQAAQIPASESVSPEAEARLWDDLERVMFTEEAQEAAIAEPDVAVSSEAVSLDDGVSETVEVAVEPLSQSEGIDEEVVNETAVVEATVDTDIDTDSQLATETESEADAETETENAIESEVSAPRFNWQADKDSAPTELGSESDSESDSELASETDVASLNQEESAQSVDSQAVDSQSADSQSVDSQAVDLNNTALAEALAKARQKARQDSAKSDEAVFTEPSPWGSPIKPMDVDVDTVAQPAVAAATADYLPAMEGEHVSAVSPVAQPLRPQKRIRSFTSVELPTFPSAKTASFKR